MVNAALEGKDFFKDAIKRNMKRAEIPHETWERDAQDREKWRRTLKAGRATVERTRQEEYSIRGLMTVAIVNQSVLFDG